MDEKRIKRASLDYWDRLDVMRYMDYTDFVERNPGAEIYYATTKARHRYSDVDFPGLEGEGDLHRLSWSRASGKA